jgi:hypothetical protein
MLRRVVGCSPPSSHRVVSDLNIKLNWSVYVLVTLLSAAE